MDLDIEASTHRAVLEAPGVDVVLATLSDEVMTFPVEYPGLEVARETLHRVGEACKAKGIKGKAIFQPLRVALTGETQGPELFYLLAGLGRERILDRLKAAALLAGSAG